ncbi:MAG: AAA family ATPase [Treponema sp.]|nr:AAA family ATPase [Treponema sp.]
MITLATKIKLPFLWGKTAFKKQNWTQVNLIVGPNGSGKTLLAQNIAKTFSQNGYKCKFLSSERRHEEEILEILSEKKHIRTKTENVLSNMFGKSIKFEKDSNGNLIPMVVNKAWNVEYNLKDQECHGLKEILTLLVSLYSSEENCIIIDEPELHLHPQFQLFFMNEIRKTAKKQKDKIFFLITHSPFFIDLLSPKDLIGVVVCHINTCPTYIEKLKKEDENLFKRFLPRFNTYHKQFFFSDNQIFVEGYTDQQIFSLLLSRMDNHIGTAGTGIIDVGGKDELGVFCKVCNLLGTDARIIGDLDSLFRSKLRDVVCEDIRVQNWLDAQFEKQLPFYKTLFENISENNLYRQDKNSKNIFCTNIYSSLSQKITLDMLICRLEDYLVTVGKFICENDIKFHSKKNIDSFSQGYNDSLASKTRYENSHIGKIMLFTEKCRSLYNKYDNAEDLDTFKTVVLQGIYNLKDNIYDILPLPLARIIPLIRNLASLVFAAAEAARVYILNNGCIEHYYVKNKVEYMPIIAKDKLFRYEYNYIMECSNKTLQHKYAQLISILQKACDIN